jgi:uncharacterized membrane protein
VFFIPLLTGDYKKDDFVKFHTKQSIVLFAIWLLFFCVQNIFPWFLLPIHFVFSLLWLCLLVLLVVGIINAAGGKKEPLPLVGKFADLIKF